MENITQTKSILDRSFDLFQEKLKSFISFLHTFTVLTIIFFLCIFIPYTTLTGNVADWVDGKTQKNCVYDLEEIIKQEKIDDSLNKKRFSTSAETLKNRLNDLKTPFIDKIPISAGEATLYFPVLITIFLLLISLRFRELVNLHRYFLIETNQQDGIDMRKYAQIPLLYIAFLIFLIATIYLLSLSLLFGTHEISGNKTCNLLNIIREQIPYRQHINWYYFFYGVSILLFLSSAVFIFKLARKYLKKNSLVKRSQKPVDMDATEV